ncbi:Chitinase domain-containing protein 1, partial [Nowakowskiella sp. JEL0078]
MALVIFVILTIACLFQIVDAKEQIIIGSTKKSLSVSDRDLITSRPSAQSILDNHDSYSLEAAHIRVGTTKNMVLAYVTPWNNHGYDIVKKFRGKFTHISPVWYFVKIGEDGFYLEGGHDVDQGWIDEIKAPVGETGFIAKVVPRFQFSAWSQEVFTAVMQKNEIAEGLAIGIINEVRKHNFDGLVLETQLSGYLENIISIISRGLRANNKDFFLVIPPKREDLGTQYDDFSTQNFQLLETYVDGFSLMSYDYTFEGPGPSSPSGWMEDAVFNLAPTEVNREKILLGLNMYGMDWSQGYGKPLLGKDYLKILKTHNPKIHWDDDDEESYFKYTDNGVQHDVYYPTLK